MKTPAAIEQLHWPTLSMLNAIGCVAVLFFSRVPVSFPLFRLLLSFTKRQLNTCLESITKLSKVCLTRLPTRFLTRLLV